MPEAKSAKKATRRPAKRAAVKASETFTAEEKAAMKEYAKERRAAARGAEAESAVLEKIAEMPDVDRAIAERLHAIVKDVAPELSARTWYGMPAYEKDGKIICFFQTRAKFKARYATLGFTDNANLDEGAMWAAGFAVTELTDDVEAEILRLVRRAVS